MHRSRYFTDSELHFVYALVYWHFTHTQSLVALLILLQLLLGQDIPLGQHFPACHQTGQNCIRLANSKRSLDNERQLHFSPPGSAGNSAGKWHPRISQPSTHYPTAQPEDRVAEMPNVSGRQPSSCWVQPSPRTSWSSEASAWPRLSCAFP